MKKILVLCLVAVMLLTSCNNTANTQTDANESEGLTQMPITEEITEQITEAVTESEALIQIPKFTQADVMLDCDPQCTYGAVLDVDKNEILYQKGRMSKKMYPASTTKILTAIVAIGICDLDVKYTVGDEQDYVASDASVADLPRGYTFDMESLLKAMMLPSGNDAAYAVAACAGKLLSDDDNISAKAAVKLFVDEMNRYAVDVIGTSGTHFTCPDGYPDDDHYTTLEDMLRISRYALEVPELMSIVGTASCTISSIPENEGGRVVKIPLSNTNKLLRRNGEFSYKYAKGMKTGTTRAAGNCLVSYAEKDGRRIICCVFKSPESDTRYTDTLNMLTAALGE